MNNFNVEEYRKALKKSGIVLMGTPVRGSLIYLPNGFKLREKLYGIAIELLKQMNFNQILLSDCIDCESIQKIDSISAISNNYFYVDGMNFYMTAGHEVSCYLLVKELLKDHSEETQLPIKYFHFGSVYRAPKNTRFPFNYGERKSFLECYGIYETSQEAYDAIEEGVLWNRKIVKDILHLPGVEVERPRATNKQISQKSVHIDTITPLGKTIITGMTYFHNDVFTKALNVKRRNNKDGKNYYVYSTHFGLSENVLHSYLINCYDGKGFRFFSFLTPTQISIIDATAGTIANFEDMQEYKKILELLTSKGYDTKNVEIASKKINKVVNNSFACGTPVVLILKKDAGNLKAILCSRECETTVNSEDIIEKIEKYFKINDEIVANILEDTEKQSIVECTTINDIVQIVANNKVAKFFCEKSDSNAMEIEKYLQGGEVLGFQETTTKGVDVITGCETNYIAFASRRS